MYVHLSSHIRVCIFASSGASPLTFADARLCKNCKCNMYPLVIFPFNDIVAINFTTVLISLKCRRDRIFTNAVDLIQDDASKLARETRRFVAEKLTSLITFNDIHIQMTLSDRYTIVSSSLRVPTFVPSL